jgi:two-component system cell cycle response regulator
MVRLGLAMGSDSETVQISHAGKPSLLNLRTPSGRAMLLVLAGARLGQRAVIDDKPLVIGRGSACDMMLASESVSRRHAVIELVADTHFIVDLGSTNGLSVNDQRGPRHALKDGDRIAMGSVVMKYLSSSNLEAACHDLLQQLVTHDGLTGLLNRAQFDIELRAAAGRARTGQSVLSLVLFDVDHFKSINDQYGHMVGDAVLTRIAAGLRPMVASGCSLARVGGEEFALICPDTDSRQAQRYAEAFRVVVGRTVTQVDGRELKVTVSLGVATAAGVTAAPQRLYEAADEQMYAAKGAGRNRVSCVELPTDDSVT